MSNHKLGFVEIAAADVLKLATAAIDKIQDRKAERLEEMILREMKDVGIVAQWWGRKSYTREEAIERIQDSDFSYWDWQMYQPTHVSPKHEKLNSLVRVAKVLVENGYTMMDISIEVANWLYS